VFYDGHGPQRDYTVTISKDQERVIDITWGPDVPAAIGGRYAIVNAGSGLCLEIAGGSTTSGAQLQQNAYRGADHQLWEINALADNAIGDLSFFLLLNAKSRLFADVPGWTHDEGAVIKQYDYPANAVEHWYFEYAGGGSYAIHSRWSDKCLAAGGTAPGAAVVQRTYTGGRDQLWRLENPSSVPVAAALQITAPPQAIVAAPGQTMTFSVGAVGTGRLAFQWNYNGTPIAGATDAWLVLPNVQSANAGNYSVVVGDVLGSTTSSTATLTLKTTADVGRLTNLSIRSNAGTGDQTLITGFSIGGAGGRKTILVRAIGPTLTAFGVGGALIAPKLDLYGAAGLLQSGTVWGGAPALATAFSSLGAFALDATSKDAAFLPTLQAGGYTAQVTGAGGATGVALMELYDATPAGAFDPATTPRLINASTRTQVGLGDNVLIMGFAVGGSTARTVLIRAAGPALASFGVSGPLAAPRLDLVRDSATLATNAGWGGDAQITAASNAVGAFALPNAASRDSALLVTLPPGTYSAKVSGADGGTGIALVEIYEVP